MKSDLCHYVIEYELKGVYVSHSARPFQQQEKENSMPHSTWYSEHLKELELVKHKDQNVCISWHNPGINKTTNQHFANVHIKYCIDFSKPNFNSARKWWCAIMYQCLL